MSGAMFNHVGSQINIKLLISRYYVTKLRKKFLNTKKSLNHLFSNK